MNSSDLVIAAVETSSGGEWWISEALSAELVVCGSLGSHSVAPSDGVKGETGEALFRLCRLLVPGEVLYETLSQRCPKNTTGDARKNKTKTDR